ncbi:glycerol kinase GlpK [Pontixanthobacter gangjinensis]|uniref:Glycerol kinase n=1 Tax=Christiangramia aestuarii TaxID=1028746 RepID=A0A7K1LR07_9FLAO|nr:glycerol kinase GlpK [Christiangramia aestuarii]MUP43051.1 glycerol kinase GlpK [Christiangramia aestuarii]
MGKYILALDQGTTSSRAILFDRKGEIVSIAQKEFRQIFPKPGWVEHDPMEIWSSQAGVAAEAVTQKGIEGEEVAAIGITNQRETCVVWNRQTGKPIYNAIVWQDKRTLDYCEKLKREKKDKIIKEKTGLIVDSYFSATKVKWILDNVDGAREMAERGELALGTIDTWLVYNFSKRKLFVTDVTNASRTMLYNINSLSWDEDLLDIFNIPASMLPEVRDSSEVYGHIETSLFASRIPISGIAGDQMAALFGQLCVKKGMVKNTYGTGCFMLMNIGDKPIFSENNLLTSVAWKIKGEVVYALEGSIFIGGAVVQWLRDGLGIIKRSEDIEKLAGTIESSEGVYFVPSFAGLGAPHWNQKAKGTIFGLTRGTTDAHISRASLEAIAYQSMDIMKAMEADSGIKIRELRVDGGATVNNLLMQFQADVLNTQTIRPKITETTALGAAYLAGLAVGFWEDIDALKEIWVEGEKFESSKERTNIEEGISGWYKAVRAVESWTEL